MDKEIRQIEFDAGDNDSKEYKIEAIWDSVVYTRESESHLLGLYYLVFWKKYPKEENILRASFSSLALLKAY